MIIRKDGLNRIDFYNLKIFEYTADTGLGSSLATIDVPPGGRHPKAFSRLSDKYYLVTDGRVRFIVDEEASDLDEGDFCFVAKGIVFSYENVSGEPARLVLVHTPAFDVAAEVFVD